MKTLLVSINSKYIHTNLALLYIMANKGKQDFSLSEYTINMPYMDILSDILSYRAGHICFSCYVWNIEIIKLLCLDIKKISNVKITIAGPQADYNHQAYIRDLDVDYIYRGDGDKCFADYTVCLSEGNPFPSHITTKDVLAQTRYVTCDLDELTSPYSQENINQFENKLVYYETSRGCPYGCTYCLSSAEKGVRFLSLERVGHDFELFVKNNVSTVKLIDRTFNADEKRAIKIVQIIKQLRGKYKESKTIFHLEVVADIINDDFLSELKSLPQEYVQLEIGIQSIKKETLCSIGRHVDIEKQSRVISELLLKNNIHIHLDIIAGLPFDDKGSIYDALEYMLSFGAHCCQLGILKLLSGSVFSAQKDQHLYCFSEKAPYEVLCNKYLTFNDLLEIKEYEDIVDRVYNIGHFKKTWQAVVSNLETSLGFIASFNDWLNKNVDQNSSKGIRSIFLYLFNYLSENQDCKLFIEILKLDYLFMGYPKYLPEWSGLSNIKSEKNAITAEELVSIGVVEEVFDVAHLRKIKNNIFITELNLDVVSMKYSDKSQKYLFYYKENMNRFYEPEFFCLST